MPSCLPPAEASDHPVDVGQRTEAVILAELVRRGYRVLVPFGVNQRYDVVVDLGDRFLRAQCKTGRIRRGAVRFNAQSIRSSMSGTFRRGYEGEVELFLVHCPDNGRVYAVPVDEATSSQGSLRVAPTANGQSKGVRWAEQYELPA
ncbi:MAG TPA: group I intron-associated PD-(D/E)XK endonuclease [Capillimicrobium sp.]|jgi:hypothetical protein